MNPLGPITARRWVTYAVLFTSLLATAGGLGYFFISNQSEIDYNSLSPQQLEEAGYYSYIFPSGYEQQFEWERTIHMMSFDEHCAKRWQDGVRWNPVVVEYMRGDIDFTIFISPNDTFFDSLQNTSAIPLIADWIPTQTGRYTVLSNGITWIKIKDTVGMDVVISSDLEPDRMAEIITHLEYNGPDSDTIGNPWVNACN